MWVVEDAADDDDSDSEDNDDVGDVNMTVLHSRWL